MEHESKEKGHKNIEALKNWHKKKEDQMNNSIDFFKKDIS